MITLAVAEILTEVNLRYNRKTVYVDGGGTTSYNVFDLAYRNIPRPIYPLDPDIASWRPG